jgi:hypothetical protein
VPRKKKVLPKPVEVIRVELPTGEVCDFLIFEDDVKVSLNKEGNIITNGSNNAIKHDDLVDRITEWVAGIYLSPQGPIKIRRGKDFMVSATEFDYAMARSGLFPEVIDFGSVRKRIYPEVKRRIDAFANALNELHNPPSGLPAILAAKTKVTVIKGTF